MKKYPPMAKEPIFKPKAAKPMQMTNTSMNGKTKALKPKSY